MAKLPERDAEAPLQPTEPVSLPGAFSDDPDPAAGLFPATKVLGYSSAPKTKFGSATDGGEVPKRSLEEYLMFFRHCTKRSAAQWQLSKRPKKRVAGEYVATEGIAAAPSNTSGTDEDLREAFEEEEILAEVIAESIALARSNRERSKRAPGPIIEMSLGPARDMLSLHNRYEDLKPTFATSEFRKATHEANLANYLQKQPAKHGEVENQIKAEPSSKTKATFLVRTWFRLLNHHWRLQRLPFIGGCCSRGNFPSRKPTFRRL
ncbi:unnamed protein product [Prunus brigantina]